MRLLVVQNIECEGPGLLAECMEKRDTTLDIMRMYREVTLPDPAMYDAMIVLGGSMSVYDVDKYPYLSSLCTAIKDHVESGGIYLGFCLGGQLLAKSLDAKVEKNPVKEIGCFDITLTVEGLADPLYRDFPETFPSIEWHEDFFGIPAGAKLLASSTLCPNQAFRYKNAYGLQYHPEVSIGMLRNWANVYSTDLAAANVDNGEMLTRIHSKQELLQEMSERFFVNFAGMIRTINNSED